MAQFIIAWRKTKRHEGGLTNDLRDKGGKTYMGIAYNYFPRWAGWAIIDAWEKNPMAPPLKDNEELQKLVEQFYIVTFWNVMKGDEIQPQEIADSIFDSSVNMGIVTGIRLAQNKLFSLPVNQTEKSERIRELGILYGKMDTKTLNMINT